MRYYARYSEVPEIFKSKHGSAWMVFDREVLDNQGGVRPILLCVNRYISFRTRDALNEQEQRK